MFTAGTYHADQATTGWQKILNIDLVFDGQRMPNGVEGSRKTQRRRFVDTLSMTD